MFQVGEQEGAKGWIHGVAACLAAVLGAYNVMAWVARPDWRLARNGALYVVAAGWELKEAAGHFRKEGAARPPREAR